MEDKRISEQESLRIITEMISKAKGGFHETGTSAILWGSVIAFCGLMSFAQFYWDFYIGFDVWILTLVALIPQAFIAAKEKKERKVLSHTETVMNIVWMVYALSIFALIFYCNVVPSVTDRLIRDEGIQLTQTANGVSKPFNYFIPSYGSLLLLLYAIPTLAGGLAYPFRAMTYGAVLCYAFFITSCFTTTTYDMLLNGLAGVFNWLIPGLILRKEYHLRKSERNV